MTLVNWLRMGKANLDTLRRDTQTSILDVNDGITSAAGITEGFVSAGASTKALGPLQRGADRVGDEPRAARNGAGEYRGGSRR